jgi:DNA-binding GntR family transcriptional regulator
MMVDQPGRFAPASAKLLHQEVTTSIFRAILDGKLKPGERLVEETIAQELGVSRSPVRQALQDMETQGILVIVPRKGAYVANWSVDDVEDFIQVRILIETKAAEQAAKRITDNDIAHLHFLVDKMVEAAEKQVAVEQEIFYDLAFHNQIVKSSRNNSLNQVFSAIELRMYMYMIYEKYISPDVDQRMELTEAHMPVVEALIARDTELAKEKIEASILRAADSFMNRMRKLEQLHSSSQNITPLIEQLKK